MSTRWRIEFFSRLCARQGSRVYTQLNTRNAEALLACLLLRPNTPCLREEVSHILWPEEQDRLILLNRLTTTLSELRTFFTDPDVFPVKSTPTIYLDLDAFETDVGDFERRLAEADKTEVQSERIRLLRPAIALYKGPLMPGCYAEWITQWRDELALKHREALCRLTQALFDAEDFEAAREQTMQWLTADVYDERAHRMLMEVYTALGRKPEALRHYESFEALLAREQKSPDPMTKMSADRLRASISPEVSYPITPKFLLKPTWGPRHASGVTLTLICMAALGGLGIWKAEHPFPKIQKQQVSPQDKASLLCQQGRTQWNKRTRDGLEAALLFFHQATQIAPEYGPAYAGLADTYGLLGYYGWRNPTESFELNMQNARKAVHWATDAHQSAEAYTSLGWADMMDWQWTSAEGDLTKAIAFDPKYSTAHQWYSLWLILHGDKDESETEIGEAEGDDPSSSVIPKSLGQRLYYSGRYDKAVRKCSEALIGHPDDVLTTLWLGLAYEQLGQREKASSSLKAAVRLSGGSDVNMLAALGHFLAASGDTQGAQSILKELRDRRAARRVDDYVSPVALALIDAGLFEGGRNPQDKAAALQQLETASHEHAGDLILMGIEPRFANLASAPTFCQIKRQIGL